MKKLTCLLLFLTSCTYNVDLVQSDDKSDPKIEQKPESEYKIEPTIPIAL